MNKVPETPCDACPFFELRAYDMDEPTTKTVKCNIAETENAKCCFFYMITRWMWFTGGRL